MIDTSSTSSLIASLEQKLGSLAQKMLKNELEHKKSLADLMETLSLKVTSLDDKLSSESVRLSDSLVKSISKL